MVFFVFCSKLPAYHGSDFNQQIMTFLYWVLLISNLINGLVRAILLSELHQLVGNILKSRSIWLLMLLLFLKL